MKFLNVLLLVSLFLFACQKKNDDKKSDASKTAVADDKINSKNRPGEKSVHAEGALVNSIKINYGKKELILKSATANPCVIFDSKYSDGAFSLNTNFAEKENSVSVVVKSNQSILREMFAFGVNTADKKNATTEGLTNFQMGDGTLKLKVKDEEFTSEKCDVSGKPRVYKTDYDIAGYELEMACTNVKQTGVEVETQKTSDRLIKIAAYCAFTVQK